MIELNRNDTIAIYGLGTETQRFLSDYGDKLSVVGLLDGFRTDGEMYGYPIISIDQVLELGVNLIIVIARPGSCKAIAKRIGDFCKADNIALFDVRGRDLLVSTSVSYEFSTTSGGHAGGSRQELKEAITRTDIISFDFFDTLVTRKTLSYTDVFELLNLKLCASGIFIPDFARMRLYAEKELSKTFSPKLVTIYERVLELVGGSFITALELATLEWEIDYNLLKVRADIRKVFKSAISTGKKVVITTDSYYDRTQIEQILNRFGLTGYDNVFVSCEYGTSKTQELYGVVSDKYKGSSILHIGDDELADIEKAGESGISSFRLYNASDLLDALGGLGLGDLNSLSDRVKVGLFLSHLFNSPFWFENESQRLSVSSSSDIGYLFCAPMITDFVHWMKERTADQGYDHILFGARDGHLIGRLFRMVDGADANDSVDIKAHSKSYYFLTSRTAAIRAGMWTVDDIEYVDSMKFFGSREEALRVRFGIEVEDAETVDRTALILDKSRQQRENYKVYIDKLCLGGRDLAFFDFVAKGTTQMYLQKLFVGRHLKGFYFLQLEPEFMADKGLDIEPFYTEQERNSSALFDNYYILETMLTSPYPQMLEMDENGRPVFAEETRNDADIKVFKRAQDGVIEYFKDYISIVPENARTVNRVLDEKLLELVNKVQILEEDFLNIKVEDPFFGRITDIRDIIG